jgi:MraZ protein
MFQGKFEHSLDDKGRLAVPSHFRRKLSDGEEALLVITIWEQRLAAYPLPEWERIATAIAGADQFNPKIQAFKHSFIANASECPVDKAGRILVPQDLRARAGIDRDCVIVGQLQKIEIWSVDRWQANENLVADLLGPSYASLADTGLKL